MSSQNATKDDRQAAALVRYNELKGRKDCAQLVEGVRMAKLGFYVHWLKPKSKRPVNDGWTTTPRNSVVDLILSYKPGYNVGWRTGVSKVGDLYVHVLDVDIKSTDANHAQEAFAAARELVGEEVFATSWQVMTGREPGMHILFGLSEKLRTNKAGLPKSEDTCTVKIDGKKVKRPAWALEFLGVGAQCAAPTSVHPDTGNHYTWRQPTPHDPQKPKLLKIEARQGWMTSAGRSEGSSQDAPSSAGIPPPVDFDILDLPQDIADLVVCGYQGKSEDESADIFGLMKDMVDLGLTEIQIASLLSDPSHGISEVAYRHAQTKNRRGAMRWLITQNLRKATSERQQRLESDLEAFAKLDAEGDKKLDANGVAAQRRALKLEGPVDWRLKLERNEPSKKNPDKPGTVKNNLHNTILALNGIFGKGLYRYNDFSQRLHLGFDLTKAGFKEGDELDNYQIAFFTRRIAAEADFEPSEHRLINAALNLGIDNRYHPIKHYLDSLVWDGKPRMATALIRFSGAENLQLHRHYSRIIFSAMVQRIYEPGKKFDHLLILESKQGNLKSTLIKAMAGGPRYFMDTELDLRNLKDTAEKLQGKWIIEQGELSTFHKSELRSLKAFMSSSEDRTRLPYGRGSKDFPRQFIFIGSTNDSIEEGYLTDRTGNRRYWGMPVGRCNVDGFKLERDQIMAEAVHRYKSKRGFVNLYLNPEMEKLANIEQNRRLKKDLTWTDRAIEFFNGPMDNTKFNPQCFSMHEAFAYGPFRDVPGGDVPTNVTRAGPVLREVGCWTKQIDNRKKWCYSPGEQPPGWK